MWMGEQCPSDASSQSQACQSNSFSFDFYHFDVIPVNQLSLRSAQPLRTCDCLFFPPMDRHNFCLSTFTTSPLCSLWCDSEGTDLQKCQTVVAKVIEREDAVFSPRKKKKKKAEVNTQCTELRRDLKATR